MHSRRLGSDLLTSIDHGRGCTVGVPLVCSGSFRTAGLLPSAQAFVVSFPRMQLAYTAHVTPANVKSGVSTPLPALRPCTSAVSRVQTHTLLTRAGPCNSWIVRAGVQCLSCSGQHEERDKKQHQLHGCDVVVEVLE